MDIETVGHAGLLIRDDHGAPVLFTDPWITGSCYWRSWWLQNYPREELLRELQSVAWCFITHEHPDHFHTASIRVLGTGPRYLCPDLPQGRMAGYLTAQGHDASVVPAFQWKQIHAAVRVLSIPLFNDDSVLVIDTPTAVIINLNDSKPRRRQLRQLSDDLDEAAPGKTRILLSSYSPASIVNSFMRSAQRVSLREKADYVRYVETNCRLMKIDYFMPFASQVIFKRRDSAWANDFKVTFEDLQKHWGRSPADAFALRASAPREAGHDVRHSPAKAGHYVRHSPADAFALRASAPREAGHVRGGDEGRSGGDGHGGGARLLPPFTRLNLTDLSHTSVLPERYHHEDEPMLRKVQIQESLDALADFDDLDVERLRQKLNYCRWLLALMFPRGIGFELEHTQLGYNPWSGTLRRGRATGDFVLKVPAQAFKDAVAYGHFGDLGTTMFTMVVLNSNIHPRRVYLFFMVITLHDYGHTTSLRNWFAWLRNTLRIHTWRIPKGDALPGPVSR
jgi:hypothetical protein